MADNTTIDKLLPSPNLLVFIFDNPIEQPNNNSSNFISLNFPDYTINTGWLLLDNKNS